MELQRMMKLLIASLSGVSFAIAGCTLQRELGVQAQERTPLEKTQQPTTDAPSEQRELDVPYVPTPQEVVAEMLKLANVTKDDVLYDLGSGDGRIVITAAQKFGTRGIGVDIDPERTKESNVNAQKAGVTDRVKFLQQDLFQTDLSEATVVTLYLLPDINVQLRPKLFKELKPGTRVVSHDFDMGDWKPDKVVQVKGPNREHTVYYWVIPKNIPDNYYWVIPKKIPDNLR